jgi:hypothetical protein
MEDINNIKAAVTQDPLEPSMLQEQEDQSVPAPNNEQVQGYQDYSQQNYQQGYQDYSQQNYQQAPQMSSDTISEISEQVATEKFATIKAELEKVIDFRNTIETKVQYLDDRLKAIEKIIDRLQLSVLQKVGDYVNNVEDIKREVSETQKTIKSLVDKNAIKPKPVQSQNQSQRFEQPQKTQ